MPQKVVEVPGFGNVEFPDSMSDDDISTAIQRDILHEQPASPPTFGQRVGRAIGNVAAGAILDYPYVKGAAKGAASTALNIGELASRGMGLDIQPLEQATKARERIKPQGPAEQAGFQGEQLGEFLIPIPGLSSVKIARAPGFLNLGARMLTAAGREAVDIGAKTAAQTGSLEEGAKAAPLGAAFGAAGPLVEKLGPALRKSAEKEYAQVLAPGTKADKYITAKKLLTPAGQDLLDRRVMGLTESGLKANISKNLMEKTVELEDAWRQLGPNHQHSLIPVLDALQQDALQAATEVVGPGQIPTPGLGNRRIVDSALYQAYQDAARDVIERLGPTADQASSFSLRKVRQLLDQFVKKSFAGQEIPAEQIRKQAQRSATDAIRNVINSQNPTIGAVNKEYSFWRNAEDVFENTNLRRVGQRRTLRTLARSGTALAAGALGYEHGGWGAASGSAVLAGYLGGKMEDILTSAAWKTTSAVTKNEVARFLAAGNGEAAANLAARAVGRARAGGVTPPPARATATAAPAGPTPRGGDKIEKIAQTIERVESGNRNPKSIAERNHNPGNLKPPKGVVYPGQTGVDANGFAIFRDREAGLQALRNQVRVNVARGLTLNEFFGGQKKKGGYPGYNSARADPEHDPAKYAQTVADALGIDPNTPLQ